jgi:hypothetical protein
MNPSSTNFDSLLKDIPHYKSYPAMMPFVGENYMSHNHAKLLLLGESFYFPEDSVTHLNPVLWYSGNQSSLTEGEIEYIHCRDLLECEWKSAGHKMYRELNGCLGELGLEFRDRAVSLVSYTNTFMRPARDSGGSFMHCCSQQDVETSVETLVRIIQVLKPDTVVFTSVYAWNVVGKTLAGRVDSVAMDFVSHPTDPFHWNVESYPNGRKKFISLLQNWLIQNQTPSVVKK